MWQCSFKFKKLSFIRCSSQNYLYSLLITWVIKEICIKDTYHIRVHTGHKHVRGTNFWKCKDLLLKCIQKVLEVINNSRCQYTGKDCFQLFVLFLKPMFVVVKRIYVLTFHVFHILHNTPCPFSGLVYFIMHKFLFIMLLHDEKAVEFLYYGPSKNSLNGPKRYLKGHKR